MVLSSEPSLPICENLEDIIVKLTNYKQKTVRRLSRVDPMSQSQRCFGRGTQKLSQAIFLKQNVEVPKSQILFLSNELNFQEMEK